MSKIGKLLEIARRGGVEGAEAIMELRGAGRAGDVTDEMMSAADQRTIFDLTPLPMDEASRMDRAREMGFRGGWFRGSRDTAPHFSENPTGRNFSTFVEPGGYEVVRSGTFFSDNPNFASDYAATIGRNYQPFYPEGANVGAYMIPRTSPLPSAWDVKDWAKSVGDEEGYDLMRWANEGWEMLDDDEGQVVKRYAASQPNFRGAYEFDEAAESLDGSGEIEGRTAVVFDPAKIRSRFARFDPAFSHLRHTSAAGAGAALVAPWEREAQNGK